MNHSLRSKFHWVILGGGTLGMAVSFAPILAFTFIVFLKPIAADFGWSRGTVSSIMAVQGIVQALLLPVIGGMIDRLGARRVLLPSLAGLGLVVLLLSVLPASLWIWYVVFAVLIPIVAAGSGTVPYSRIVTAWFDRRRGIALGLTISGIGLGALIFPSLAQSIIDSHSWRVAYIALGGIVLVVGLPIVALSLRNTPQELGLAPDHGSVDGDHKSGMEAGQFGLSLYEARRSRSFWLISLSVLLMGIAIYSVIAHLSAILTDRGMDAQKAAGMIGVLGASSMVARIVVGFLFDRFFAPRVAVFFTLGAMLATLLLAAESSLGWHGIVVAALLGLGLGAEIDLMAYLTGRYFGLKFFGAIYGVFLAIFYVGVGVGSTAVGFAFDFLGSYTIALYACGALTGAVCIVLLLLGPFPDFGDRLAPSEKDQQ